MNVDQDASVPKEAAVGVTVKVTDSATVLSTVRISV